MSTLSENRNQIKLFLLDEEEKNDQDDERKGYIYRLRNLIGKIVSVVDIPAVSGANWRTVKSESGQPQQLEMEGMPQVQNLSDGKEIINRMTTEELGDLVTNLEKEQESPEQNTDSSVSEEVSVQEEKNGEVNASTFFEEARDRLDELSTQNNDNFKELQMSLSALQSQVDKNTESITTFSFNNNESEADEGVGEKPTPEPVEDEAAISMLQVVEIADNLNQTATEIRELRESGQISQEQSDEMSAEVTSALESLETIAI